LPSADDREERVRLSSVILLKKLEAARENSKLKRQQQLAFVA
jgi:hypothetical protein